MNSKNYANKNKKGQLSEEEWEQYAQSLLNAKLDHERQEGLQKILEKQGVYRNAKASRIKSIRNIMAIASSVLLLLVAGWYAFFTTQSAAQKLAQQYLEKPFNFNEGNTRGGEEIEKNRGKVILAYKNQEFEKSLKYLQIIESTGQAKATDFFQMGLCMLYKKQPDFEKGLKFFEKTQAMDSIIYRDEINWLSGLSLVILGSVEESKIYLNKVVASKSSREQKAAKQLLLELED